MKINNSDDSVTISTTQGYQPKDDSANAQSHHKWIFVSKNDMPEVCVDCFCCQDYYGCMVGEDSDAVLRRKGVAPDCPIATIEEHDNAIKAKYVKAMKEFAEQCKMAYYYEFEELIPSVMADKIDELLKEYLEELK